MKAESNVRPKAYQFENLIDGKCDIVFNTNIQEFSEETEGQTITRYEYDTFRITKMYRDTLQNDIQSDYQNYLTEAMDNEKNILADEIRAKRDKLLADTDWTQMQDTALSPSKVKEYQDYRQALRDITKQTGFPYTVVFPVSP